MAPTALPIPLPLTPSTTPSHPALQFYIIYGQKFPKTPEQWKTQPYDELYSADCRIIKTDNSAVEGGEASWEFFRKFCITSLPSPILHVWWLIQCVMVQTPPSRPPSLET